MYHINNCKNNAQDGGDGLPADFSRPTLSNSHSAPRQLALIACTEPARAGLSSQFLHLIGIGRVAPLWCFAVPDVSEDNRLEFPFTDAHH